MFIEFAAAALAFSPPPNRMSWLLGYSAATPKIHILVVETYVIPRVVAVPGAYCLKSVQYRLGHLFELFRTADLVVEALVLVSFRESRQGVLLPLRLAHYLF
jgi:hypothetical protein